MGGRCLKTRAKKIMTSLTLEEIKGLNDELSKIEESCNSEREFENLDLENGFSVPSKNSSLIENINNNINLNNNEIMNQGENNENPININSSFEETEIFSSESSLMMFDKEESRLSISIIPKSNSVEIIENPKTEKGKEMKIIENKENDKEIETNQIEIESGMEIEENEPNNTGIIRKETGSSNKKRKRETKPKKRKLTLLQRMEKERKRK